MQSCGDYIVRHQAPLRDRLLRYYAETADQVQRLLRVTANGAQHFPIVYVKWLRLRLPRLCSLHVFGAPAGRTQARLGSCAGKFSSPHAGPDVPVSRPEALRSVVGHIRVCHLASRLCQASMCAKGRLPH